MKAKLGAIADGVPDNFAAALFSEGQRARGISQRLTPVDIGALRADQKVEQPMIQGRNISVRIVVGEGPAKSYALPVHEDMKARHKVGGPKFLERALYASKPGMAARIASRAGARMIP